MSDPLNPIDSGAGSSHEGAAVVGVVREPPSDAPSPLSMPVAATREARVQESAGPLLSGLGDVATHDVSVIAPSTDEAAKDTRHFENHLAMVRLGMATSLFFALRSKHSPTAAHSLRVALACSSWCSRLGMKGEHRDRIEVAALLHDIGKIGIPDRILRKPSKLTQDEQLTVECCPRLGYEILRGCTSDQELLDIVLHANDWYQSRRRDDGISEDALPLGSRMLSIAGAFDAMTTDQVYRAAKSRERALQELFQGSGTQFDPVLTRDFVTMLEGQPELLHQSVIDRWLQNLDGRNNAFMNQNAMAALDSSSPGGLGASAAAVSMESLASARTVVDPLAGHAKTLCDESRDGVAFTDAEKQILFWNDSMTRLTGLTHESIVGRQWDTSTLGLMDRDGNGTMGCIADECLRHRMTVARPMVLKGRGNGNGNGGKTVEVVVQAAPVTGPDGRGVVITLRDMSDRKELEQQIESLHVRATCDPLTGVANRAELDRRLDDVTQVAKETGQTFSLVICDIDHFKQVNDVHGHPAGDEALVEFAAVLQHHARSDDLVARYGGEEFVMLATTSDNATAAKRAEEIRKAISTTPLQGLGGESVTVSFGVTEFQTGDSSDTVLARADRALLLAKENGRNRVVQLGTGIVADETTDEATGWLNWLGLSGGKAEQEFKLATAVPLDLAVEKLRGFIADHRAEIIEVTSSEVSLRMTTGGGSGRRAADSQFGLHLLISMHEGRDQRGRRGSIKQTRIRTVIKPTRSRDRRHRNLQPCIKEVVGSLKSYLMAELVADET
ncbi:MAG: diguanylate cyclase [Planctomycetota bacterium]